jgi:RND superfamily putative drug exporter
VFDRIAALVARHAKAVLLVWVVAAGLLVALAPPFAEVATQDERAFLGSGAPSVIAAKRVFELWPEDEFTLSAAVVVTRDGGLTPRDRAFLRDTEAWLNGPEAPENVRLTQTAFSRPELRDALTSPDGRASIMVVGFTTPPFEPATNEAVATIRQRVAQTKPAGAAVHVTGNAGVGADQNAAIQTGIHRTTLITLVLVTAILLWVYRSPVAPLVPLLTIGLAFTVARSLVALIAAAGLTVSALVETFMVVIVFGAGTDYCLFIVSRYKEELLAHGADARRTLVATMAIIGGVIASSAATVIVGFGSQSVAQFGMFRTMGPAMAIAVAITLVAGLTLTPALLRLFGTWAFWPRRLGAADAGPAPAAEDIPVAGPAAAGTSPAPASGKRSGGRKGRRALPETEAG